MMNDLWLLQKCVTVVAYILMASFLLCFDLEISKSVKVVVVPIYFALNFVLAYKYRQVLRKFKLYERILGEILSSSFFSNFKNKELCSLPKLYKSRDRRLSYPITSVEYRFFQSNWEHSAQNGLLRDNLYEPKPETRVAALNKSVGTSQVYHEIRTKLHKCVKNMDSIIQRVKALNLDYSRILEDTAVVNQNSEMVIKKESLKNKIPEDEEDIQHKLESTNCVNEISYNMKNRNVKTWTPLKDLDSVQRMESSNSDYFRNLRGTPFGNQNSETVTKKDLQNQIAMREKDRKRKLKTKKRIKEISCTVKGTSTLPEAPNQVLDTKLSKSIKINSIRDMDQILQTLALKIKKNQIPKEVEEIKHKCICHRHAKMLSTLKNNIVPQVPHRDLGTKYKLTKNVLAPKNIPAHYLLASMLQYEGTYEALSAAKEFIRRLIFIEINSDDRFLIKIPLNRHDYSRLNHVSITYLERIELIFYETKAPIRHKSEAVINMKEHVPKLPMRPYICNVSFTPHMIELSRERYINSILMRKSVIKKITPKYQQMFRENQNFCRLANVKDMRFL